MQIARRAQPGSNGSAPRIFSSSGRAVRYQAVLLDEEIFMHPRSGLHHKSPEFVVYSQLVRSAKRPYMAGMNSEGWNHLQLARQGQCCLNVQLHKLSATYSGPHQGAHVQVYVLHVLRHSLVINCQSCLNTRTNGGRCTLAR